MKREEKIAILKDIIDGEIVHPQVRKDVGIWAIGELEQERTDEWQDGYDRAWEEAEVFYEKEEPTSPCDLCRFNIGEFCEYLSDCPATGRR